MQFASRNTYLPRNGNYSNFSFAQNLSTVNFEDANMESSVVVKLAAQVLVALFGVTGNIMVAIIFGGLGKKKTTANFYVQNLAIADLGFLLLTFPFIALREKAPLNWPLGEFTCIYLYPITEIFHGASVWYIAVVAVERYRKIVLLRKPRLSEKRTSLKYPKIAAACIWVLSFLVFCLPIHFVVKYGEMPNDGKWCDPVWPSLVIVRVYVVLLTVFSYILPLLVISWTYFAISRKLSHSSKFLKDMTRSLDGAEGNLKRVKSVRLRQNKRAKKILTPIVVVFAITMLPLSILRLTYVFWPVIAEQKYYNNLLYAVTVFVIINSSVNPVIYSIASKDFRTGIKTFCRQTRGRYRSLKFSGMIQLSRARSMATRRSRHDQVNEEFHLSPLGISKKSIPDSETKKVQFSALKAE